MYTIIISIVYKIVKEKERGEEKLDKLFKNIYDIVKRNYNRFVWGKEVLFIGGVCLDVV